jgi:hypothetical protein
MREAAETFNVPKSSLQNRSLASISYGTGAKLKLQWADLKVLLGRDGGTSGQ